MFSQILKLIPRLEFEALMKKTKAEYAAKGLSSWAQFVAMLFCQLGRAHSLREIEGGLKSCEGKLAHLGIEAPARSSLSYANAHRPWELFEGVFHGLFEKVAATVAGKRRKFRFKNKLVSIDSTVIDLSLSMYDWAKYQRTKGAVKLHLVLDHDGYLPCFGVITDGTVHDVKVAQQLRFAPGTIVVDDRGYNDYRLFGRWCAEGVFFVTRMKIDALHKVVEQRVIAPEGRVVADQLIRLSGQGAAEKCPHALRRVEVVREDTGETLVFVTNLLNLSPNTIAAIYKDRWQIELFFKALKQNLKIKTFVGTSANAVKTQIWTALITMLLRRYLQLRSRFGWSLANLVALLQLPAGCLVAMEACSGAHHWARRLRAKGLDARLIAAGFVTPYRMEGRSGKNDATDAAAICEAASRPSMRFVPVKTPEQQGIMGLHRIREGLKEERTARVNRIRGVLAEFGLVFAKSPKALRAQLAEVLEDASNELSGTARLALQEAFVHWRELDDKLLWCDRQIGCHVRSSADARRAATITGIGEITASAITASMSDLTQFKNGAQFGAWLGLVPSQNSSGGKARLGRITKRGDDYLRTLLIPGAKSAVMSAHKRGDPTSRWLVQLKERAGWQKACVAMANKNARILWAVMTREAAYDPHHVSVKPQCKLPLEARAGTAPPAIASSPA